MPQRSTVLSSVCASLSKVRFLAAAGVALASCSPATVADREARAREATATVLRTAPEQIEVSKLESGGAKWTWQAIAGGKIYACDADDRMRLPNCLPSG